MRNESSSLSESTDTTEAAGTEAVRAEQAASTGDRAAWKRYGRPGLLLVVTGVSLYLLFPSIAAVFSSSRSLERLTWYWAALAFICEAGSLVCLWELNRIALHLRGWLVV